MTAAGASETHMTDKVEWLAIPEAQRTALVLEHLTIIEMNRVDPQAVSYILLAKSNPKAEPMEVMEAEVAFQNYTRQLQQQGRISSAETLRETADAMISLDADAMRQAFADYRQKLDEK